MKKKETYVLTAEDVLEIQRQAVSRAMSERGRLGAAAKNALMSDEDRLKEGRRITEIRMAKRRASRDVDAAAAL